MKLLALAVFLAWVPSIIGAPARQLFEATSAYHNIRVVEQDGLRVLHFDDTTQTKISVRDPLAGHFEYTEYFQMPWLWKTNISKVLMIGLGGGSTQIALEHYYPGVTIESVEIDPLVVQVAKDYFGFKESSRQKVHVSDGRLFLRRTTAQYDLILVDAYVAGRYGSSIPQHLATKEFMHLLKFHLPDDGVVAFNVIGTLSGWHADLVGAIYRTMSAVFPQVAVFPAQSSLNIVLVASRSPKALDLSTLRSRANSLVASGQVTFPRFRQRLERLHPRPPANAQRSPVLTDDYAPVEGLSAAASQ
jgi:spermidine synthase